MLKKIFFVCAAAGLDLSRAEVVSSGRACQRPRTSSGAKCFSCAGALAKNPQIFKFFEVYTETFFKTRVALPEATPSPFGTATLRLAPSALTALGLRSAAKRAPRCATFFTC